MKIANSTVLITRANRGIGLAFAKALLERDARKVSAGIAQLGRFLADEMTQPVKNRLSAEQAIYLAAR